MANPTLPGSSGFSVAQAGARLGKGLGGIYRKADSRVLIKGSNNTGVAVPFSARVYCPSSRIRVAFGVGGKSPDMTDDPTNPSYTFGSDSWWNVVPRIRLPGSDSDSNATSDKDEYISGRPLFWVSIPGSSGTLTRDYYGGALYLPPPYVESQPAGSSYAAEPNILPEVSVSGLRYGRNVPDAYEAISNVDRYDIYGERGLPGIGNPITLQVWAVWEIIDPRDEEDSIALLNMCRLEAPNAK